MIRRSVLPFLVATEFVTHWAVAEALLRCCMPAEEGGEPRLPQQLGVKELVQRPGGAVRAELMHAMDSRLGMKYVNSSENVPWGPRLWEEQGAENKEGGVLPHAGLFEWMGVAFTPDDLSTEAIGAGLGGLSVSPFTGRPTFLEVSVSGQRVKGIGALSGYPDLQVVRVSRNLIEDVGALADLPQLREVDLSHNRLQEVIGFSIPCCDDSNACVKLREWMGAGGVMCVCA
jgi:hypothetical protein